MHYSKEDTRFPVIKNVITVNSSVTHVSLDRMKPLTRYRVWISGFTRKGNGPSSEKEFVSTPQAGTFESLVILYLLSIALPFLSSARLGVTLFIYAAEKCKEKQF